MIKISHLKVYFTDRKPRLWSRSVPAVKAVDDLSLEIHRGETLGLVGESGCGKSTTGRAILQLVKPTSGSVVYEGKELVGLSAGEMRPYRRNLQMIFQNPYASLNPRMTVGDIIAEPLITFGARRTTQLERQVQALMERVGLEPRYVRRYPHEFSGGQRQRVAIARALALEPAFIVADEPIAALDVSIQAQIMNLLKQLQQELGLTYLFISHDLRAVRYMSSRIAVMYLGKIVELGPASEVYSYPKHPYTQALISAVPVPNPVVEAERKRIRLQGDVPNAADPPSGCHFHPRCPHATEQCRTSQPTLEAGTHTAACFLV